MGIPTRRAQRTRTPSAALGESPLPRPLSGASILDRYLERLKKLKPDYAVEALSTPKGRDTFEYGKHCGFIDGLTRAEQLLQEVIGQESDERE